MIFSHEKHFETTKKINPVNDRILFRDASKILKNIRNVYQMQKPASVMVWGQENHLCSGFRRC
ncbi:Hypothetical protein FKW44_022499 [Caligus rogercresseyi]|uniref:Uncharacterized protein n=1 Tax=Caligus rogercresseyi TaxID=217165 RepID=A0A7T8GMH9_CALRO|nr:Hypothetical protein FKW44_022499 [Caligus rogercresseyi]